MSFEEIISRAMVCLGDSRVDPLVVRWLRCSMSMTSRWLRAKIYENHGQVVIGFRRTVCEYLGVYGRVGEMGPLVDWCAVGISKASVLSCYTSIARYAVGSDNAGSLIWTITKGAKLKHDFFIKLNGEEFPTFHGTRPICPEDMFELAVCLDAGECLTALYEITSSAPMTSHLMIALDLASDRCLRSTSWLSIQMSAEMLLNVALQWQSQALYDSLKKCGALDFFSAGLELIGMTQWTSLHTLLQFETKRSIAKNPSDNLVAKGISGNLGYEKMNHLLESLLKRDGGEVVLRPSSLQDVQGSDYYEFDLYVAILLGDMGALHVMAGWGLLSEEAFWDAVSKAAADISCEQVLDYVENIV